MTETIMITGASGTVGKAAGEYLCNEGFNVIGVSRSVRKDVNCYTEVIQLDLLNDKDLQELEEMLKDVDAVFHLAWNIPVENFDTHEAWEGNIEMFENILQASISGNVPIFINGSSIHAGTGDMNAYTVEGDLEKTPQPYRGSLNPDSDFDLRRDEPSKLLDPRDENPDSPYGWSKVITERATRKAVEKGDIRLGISIRIGGVNSEDREKMEGEPYYHSLYWSHRDLGRTIENILTADLKKKKHYHQFYGVSDNPGRIFDIENSFIT